MTARSFLGALAALAVGSVLVLVSFGATWATVTVAALSGATSPSDPISTVVLTGRDLAPLGATMGWVGLAAVAALLATRTWGRRVTGALVVVAGGSAGVAALAFALTDVASGSGGAFIQPALGARVDGDVLSIEVTAWWLPATAGGLLMVVCGVLAVAVGPAWPRLSSRYNRSGPAEAPRSAAATWDALDRGEDPTADAKDPHPGSGPPPGSMEGTNPEELR